MRSTRGPILWGGHAQRGAPSIGECRLVIFQGVEKFRTKFQRLEEKVPKLGNWPRRGGIAERCNAEGRNRRRRNSAAKHTAPPAGEPERRRRNSGGSFPKAAAGKRSQASAISLQESGRDGRVTVCVGKDLPPRKGCSWERKSWAPRKILAGIPGSIFSTGSALE